MNNKTNDQYERLQAKLDLDQGAGTFQFRGTLAYQMPRIVGCRSCYGNPNCADLLRKESPCSRCAGTGREPIPFSEVWGDAG